MAPSQSVVSFGLLQGAIIRTDYAGNMVAIHCHAGMAQAACASFDRMQHPDIVGTLAGDDTIFILMRTPEHPFLSMESMQFWVSVFHGIWFERAVNVPLFPLCLRIFHLL